MTPSKMPSNRSDAVRAAALLEREEILIEEAQHVDEASYRRCSEINAELAEIHRLLEALGLRSKDNPS